MVGWANAARSVKSVSDFRTVNSNVIGFHRGNRALTTPSTGTHTSNDTWR
ncbi:hypothetical protein ACFV1N_43760 [Streptosporangium canum]